MFGRLDAIEHAAQPFAFGVGQSFADAVGLGVRDEDHESAGKRDFLGQASTLGSDWVLGHLAQDHLAGLQQLFDAWFGSASGVDIVGIERHITGVQHGILGCGDVDERCFHARQHVLYPAEIDVAVDFRDVIARFADMVFDQVATLDDRHLGVAMPDVHRHEVPAERPSVAFLAAPSGQRCFVDLDRTFDNRLHRADGSALTTLAGLAAAVGPTARRSSARRRTATSGRSAATGGRRALPRSTSGSSTTTSAVALRCSVAGNAGGIALARIALARVALACVERRVRRRRGGPAVADLRPAGLLAHHAFSWRIGQFGLS